MMNEIASPINNEGNDEQKTQPLFQSKTDRKYLLLERKDREKSPVFLVDSLLNPEFFTHKFFPLSFLSFDG